MDPEEYSKMRAEKALYGQTPNPSSIPPGGSAYFGDSCTQGNLSGIPYRQSLVEEAEKNYIRHSEQAAKAQMAALFLRANPAFDEFIKLIRSGAIGI